MSKREAWFQGLSLNFWENGVAVHRDGEDLRVERYRDVGGVRIKNVVLDIPDLRCLFTWGGLYETEVQGKGLDCNRNLGVISK